MELHGFEVVGAGDLTEAGFIWSRDRYDLVLIDIRGDYRGCLAWRDEIKKESPQQIVAFLVGRPQYIDLAPLENSYLADNRCMEWGDSLRQAVRKSCESLPQRNGFAEAIWRITAARRINGAAPGSRTAKSTEVYLFLDPSQNRGALSPALHSAKQIFGSNAEDTKPLSPVETQMENE